MNRNRKKLHGAVAIETVLTLPVFMIAIIAIMMFAMLFRAQSAMQYALNQTAKEISGYFYLLDKLGVASVLSGNATDEARADVQDVNTTIDHIVSFSGEIKDASGKYKQTYLEYKESFENGSLTVEDIKRIQNIKDEALEDNKALQAELEKIKADLNTIKNGDKRKMLKGILQVFGKSMINRVVSKYATPYICEALMPKYLTDGDVNAFYRAAGIIPESISFADSKMLSDGRTISLDVTYRVDASKLSLGFYRKELKFHQIATTSAWIRKNESGSLLSLSDLNAMFFGENSGELVAAYLANIQAEEDAKTTAATEVTTEADNESTSTVSSTTTSSDTDVSSTDSSETSTKSTETSTEVSTVSSDSSEVSSKSTQSTSTTTKPNLPQIDQSDPKYQLSQQDIQKIKDGKETEVLHEKLTAWANDYKNQMKKRNRQYFNTGTVVYDETTNTLYYGRNAGIKNHQPDLNPIIFGDDEHEGILRDASDSKENWSVDNCAEVDAVNTALNDGAQLKNLHMYTIWLEDGEIDGVKHYAGDEKAACENCTYAFWGRIGQNSCGWTFAEDKEKKE